MDQPATAKAISWKRVILTVIIAALILALVVWLYWFFILNKPVSTTPGSIKVSTPSSKQATPSAKSNGKFKVTSKYCGFSLEYNQPAPSGDQWKFQEFENKFGQFEYSAQLYAPRVDADVHAPGMSVSCAENKEGWTLDELANNLSYSSSYMDIQIRVASKTTTTINGLPALKVTLTDAMEPDIGEEYLMIQKGKRYGIVFSQGGPKSSTDFTTTFNQVLNTISF